MATTVYKAAGSPVFPPHADPNGDCVLRRLLAAEPSRAALAWPDGFEGGLCHRLDTSTSGALLVADDPQELAKIRAAFAARAFTKTYRLWTAHDVPWDTHRCDARLAHAKTRKGRMVVERGANTAHRGRWHEAHTRFERLSPNLWRAAMTTGVMHQIRLHAAFLGLPLAGDNHYGGGPLPEHAPSDALFLLHHEGLTDGARWATTPVPLPAWAAPPPR